MAVKMRLTRLGDKKSPFYRIVVADSRVSRDKKYIDLVGTYNPLTTPEEVKIDVEKAQTVINWFEINTPTGYYSINDTIGDILSKLRGKLAALKIIMKLKSEMSKSNKENNHKKVYHKK